MNAAAKNDEAALARAVIGDLCRVFESAKRRAECDLSDPTDSYRAKLTAIAGLRNALNNALDNATQNLLDLDGR